MARPLRVEYAGALYHVMNRGNRRERVFRKAADYELLLPRLARFSAEFGVDVCELKAFGVTPYTNNLTLTLFYH